MQSKPLLSFIPAQAGWFVIDIVGGYSQDDKLEDKYWLQPIVGWRIETHEDVHNDSFSTAMPICPETINRDYFLLAPDGIVNSPEDRSWPNIAEFVKDQELKEKK